MFCYVVNVPRGLNHYHPLDILLCCEHPWNLIFTTLWMFCCVWLLTWTLLTLPPPWMFCWVVTFFLQPWPMLQTFQPVHMTLPTAYQYHCYWFANLCAVVILITNLCTVHPIIQHSYFSWTAWSWRWRYCDPSKCCEPWTLQLKTQHFPKYLNLQQFCCVKIKSDSKSSTRIATTTDYTVPNPIKPTVQ
jgi:hypothetical protein